MGVADLLSSAERYFERQGYSVERNVILNSGSGIPRLFELQAKKKGEVCLVYVREWDRTVGINMVINIDKAVEDVGLGRPALVANKFSEHARFFATRRGILLLTPRELGQYHEIPEPHETINKEEPDDARNGNRGMKKGFSCPGDERVN